MWVSCTRASGCLQSYMIYSWLLGEAPHTHTHKLTCSRTYALVQKETKSETEQCVIHMLNCQRTRVQLSQTDTETDTLHSQHAVQVSRPSSTLLCVSQRCQSISVSLPCKQNSSCDTCPGRGPIMAVNPANAPGAKHGAARERKDRFLAQLGFFRMDSLSLRGPRATGLLTGQTYMTSVGKCGPASDAYMRTICLGVARTPSHIL